MVGSLDRWECVEQLTDGARQAVDAALDHLVKEGLELGEGPLDRIEFGRPSRPVAQAGVAGLDRLVDAGDLVTGQVVHHDDFAGLKLRGVQTA